MAKHDEPGQSRASAPHDERLSRAPLSFEEALAGLLQGAPPPKDERAELKGNQTRSRRAANASRSSISRRGAASRSPSSWVAHNSRAGEWNPARPAEESPVFPWRWGCEETRHLLAWQMPLGASRIHSWADMAARARPVCMRGVESPSSPSPPVHTLAGSEVIRRSRCA